MAALDDPQTRAALAAHRAGALRWLGGGALAVVLGCVAGAAVVRIARDGGERPPLAGLVVVTLVAGGIVGVVVGVGALVRTRRWSRALAGTGWQTGVLRVAGPATLHVEPVGYDDLTDEPLRLRLLSTAVWRTRAVQRLDGAEVTTARVSPREWVLTADGAGTVYGARVTER
ncbi:hypothetical protein [Modestobacter sp. SYSU DS0875]